VWTDELVEDYDYSYTLFDEIPHGWKMAFGLQLAEELREQLIKDKFLYDFRFVQIKEKYGSLRLYNNGCSRECWNILDKYESLSLKTCIECGSTEGVELTDDGWILPLCTTCMEEENKNNQNIETRQQGGAHGK
jgi:hypothetical protein